MLEALIFDVDGTLADTERDGHRPAFNAAFAEMGLDWHWDAALYGELLEVTGGKERIRFFCERHEPEFLQQADAEVRIRELHAAKTRHYVELCAQGIPLRPGVERLLREARAAGLRLAIATTTTPENISALLAPDLLALFEKVGAGDTVPNKKPAPDIYQWVLAQLGLPAAACLAIEDSANGLRASRGAGLATVITRTAYTDDHDFSGALAILPDLDGVTLETLRRIHGNGIDISANLSS
ncbi:HAD-IA family hydrolase [Sulfuritalea sp.]|uniref:HAD-IA family hydrolase n=1 Tax=Sulfuritalea sp. TaxID=2480090 RepID=UPI001ACA74BA|nr:HAD-IA family hydrolase [Sulfuritalea sp.]MBN8475640.1 HAD-IA family hydrolase [Sulfuritalea sp.]